MFTQDLERLKETFNKFDATYWAVSKVLLQLTEIELKREDQKSDPSIFCE